jgi:tetratricopeptide (TPR) repeat protein
LLSKEDVKMSDGENVNDSDPQDAASIPELMQRAAALHNEGDLESAEALYRKVLASDPENPDSLHLLGLLASQLGFWEEGAQLKVTPINLYSIITLPKHIYREGIRTRQREHTGKAWN